MNRETDIKELREKLTMMAEAFVQNSIAVREVDPEKSYTWFISSEICRKAAEELERLEPVRMEVEGGGRSWFLTCGECGTVVAEDSKFCCECGHPFFREK